MSFFKAYDMRGTYGRDFDLELVRRIGRVLPDVVGRGRWLVGRDCRLTSADIRDALVAGLLDAGVDVDDLGLATTPMVYFFTGRDDYAGSVMVTASHNPPADNGLKVSRRHALPVGYADGLDKVEHRVAGAPPAPVERRGSVRLLGEDARAAYVAWQRQHGGLTPDAPALRYAVDCSNGMSSLLVRDLFPGAIVLNEGLDGNFPCHAPNPLKEEARAELAACVRERGLDCGIIFDGDADRAMFVDERGAFVQSDYLIPIVARATRAVAGGVPGTDRPKVIHDVRTSRGALEQLVADGFEPVMVPVGHAFAKPALRKNGALCGGELAGHYYFSEFFSCDSGVLAARRILGEIAAARAQGRSFHALMAPITERYANSGERNFRVDDKKAAIERALAAAARALPRERSRSTMDGFRLEYDEGWVNLRVSNTEPFLRLIAECDTADRLTQWLEILSTAISPK